jgi:Family of unknown function (DUF5455)
MGALAAFISGLTGGLASLIGQIIGRKSVLILLAVTVITGMTVALVAAINAAIALAAVAVPEVVFIAASWVVPSNASTCIGAVVAGHVARWIYDTQYSVLSMKVGGM